MTKQEIIEMLWHLSFQFDGDKAVIDKHTIGTIADTLLAKIEQEKKEEKNSRLEAFVSYFTHLNEIEMNKQRNIATNFRNSSEEIELAVQKYGMLLQENMAIKAIYEEFMRGRK